MQFRSCKVWMYTFVYGFHLACFLFPYRLLRGQKGVITIQQCSIQNQKGAITMDLYSNSALLVLKRTSLNSDNALLAFNWWYKLWRFTTRIFFLIKKRKKKKESQLRARRALLQIKDVLLRTRRVLLSLTLYSNSALLVLNGTSLNCNNTLLALNWQNSFSILYKNWRKKNMKLITKICHF